VLSLEEAGYLSSPWSQVDVMCSLISWDRPFLEAASFSLNSSKEALPIKIFACRALANFCPRMNKDIVGPYLAAIMDGLISILDVVSAVPHA